MELFTNLYDAGVIDRQTYDNMVHVVYHVQAHAFEFVQIIYIGLRGSVWRVLNKMTDEEMALKVVPKQFAYPGEVDIWKTLHHPNVIPLELVHVVSDCYLFFMPLFAMDLQRAVSNLFFQVSRDAIAQVLEWLEQSVSAVAYLHGLDLSHNDIKPNNILLANDCAAFLSDFGYVKSAEKPNGKYGVPVIYCAPEARIIPGRMGRTEVDGKKLDVWCLGTLAFEIFTGMRLKEAVEPCIDRFPSWYTYVYPGLKERLERENFLTLVQETYPYCEILPEFAEMVLNFIKACLDIVPENRPTVHQLLQHTLFGGTWEYDENRISIWNYRVTRRRLEQIFGANQVQLFPANGYEKFRTDDFVTSEAMSVVSVDCVQSPALGKPVVGAGSSVPHRDQESATLGVKEGTDISRQELRPVIPRKPPSSRCQRFRAWCREKKAAFISCFTSCCPRRRK